ncbi:MAG: Stp1/IreP family PP2C-type Ser/Thr phosphatase [Myxococcota bacterium]|nr:Stp1/IreP family PP2C-type Ser/Thr phosphatase [Myxococcota bacterium]MDW8361710.1 Stp1/IreP family PP2C-type Ser/Thr phosphatase [Myxococcales bacterium]
MTEVLHGDGVRFWPVTDVGRVRDHNEDAFLVDRKLSLFMVADGMGGHAAGEVASHLAVKTVRERLARDRDVLVAFEQGNVSRTEVLRLLESAVQQACAAVHQAGVQDEARRGMGTTLEVLLLVGSRGFIAHVGDSRIYLVRQGHVHQLTEDHSLVNELLRRGRLTREQIEKVQYKNAVTRAVGVYESVEVDTLDFDVLPGDRFLLCTDGLHGYLEEGDIPRLLESCPEEQVAQRLVDLANERGGKDNISVVYVRVPDAEAGYDKLTRELNLKLEVMHRMPLFRYLTFQELVRVLNIVGVRSYGVGEPVVREGEEGDELFIVLRGQVRVHSGDTILTRLAAGQHFGEMALVDKAPRSASVTADEPSQLLVIRRRDFFDVIRRDHTVAVKLLWSLCNVLTERLRTTSRDLERARERLSMSGDVTAELLGEIEELTDASAEPAVADARPTDPGSAGS